MIKNLYHRIVFASPFKPFGLFTLLLPLIFTGCHHRGNETIPMPPPMAGVSNLFVGPTAELGRHENLRSQDVRVTSTGNTLDALFDKAQLSAQLAADANIQTWNGSMKLALDPVLSEEVKTLRTHFRYSLTKDEGTRALLLFSINGQYFVEDYGFAQKVDGEQTKEVEIKWDGRSQQNTSIHVHMMLERRSKNSIALLTLDSIDIWGITGKEQFPK